jgi:8-oxo-dGTP diphosphatase
MAHDNTDWAASVIVCGPNDTIPLVMDERKPTPHYWKLPGGRKEAGETPEETAVRETEEEVGLKIGKVCILKEVDRRSHTMYLFGTQIKSFDELRAEGEEGERVALFTMKEVQEMVDFFPPHRELLEEIGVLTK